MVLFKRVYCFMPLLSTGSKIRSKILLVSGLCNGSIARRSHWSGLSDLINTREDGDLLNKFLNDYKFIEKLTRDHGGFSTSNYSKEKRDIDWIYWRKILIIPQVVDCLEMAHKDFSKIIDDRLRIPPKKDGSAVQESENFLLIKKSLKALYTKVLEDCTRVFNQLNEFLSAGLQCLWISHRNPDVWKVAPHEWLDSDLWWQAYVERHHYFDPSKDIDNIMEDTFEDEKKFEAKEASWHKAITLFHNRSDTPTLYNYMDQLHSFEYYSVFRRKFIEHMLYFLVRTGKDYHFFPEIPPASWIKDIEALRYSYLVRANERRSKRQLKTLKREEALDLLPLDSQLEHAEEYFSNLFLHEKQSWELVVGHLMMNFIFLSYPALPIQSIEALYSSLAKDNGRGCFYSLGDDVDALFYIPAGELFPFTISNKERLILMPSDAVRKWTKHIVLTGGQVNSGYLDCLALYAHLLDKRGRIWFCGPNESIPDGFLRRFSPEDPQREVFEEYVDKLRVRWKNARQIELNDVLNRIPSIEAVELEICNALRCLKVPGNEGFLNMWNRAKEGNLASTASDVKSPVA